MRLAPDSFELLGLGRPSPRPRGRRIPVFRREPLIAKEIDPRAPAPLGRSEPEPFEDEPPASHPEPTSPQAAPAPSHPEPTSPQAAPAPSEPATTEDAEAPSEQAADHAEDELARAMARVEREAKRQVEREQRALLSDFIEVLDDLDRAIDASDGSREGDGVLMQGVEIVRERFLSKLKDRGVSRGDDLLMPFDPKCHEAICLQDVADRERDGVVVKVVRAGYAIDGELLRPATVVVGRHRADM